MDDNRKKDRNDGTIRLYHYTSQAGFRGINDQKTINQSIKPRGVAGDDAAHGTGTYLTSMDPRTHSKAEVARNNYDGSKLTLCYKQFIEQGHKTVFL